MAQFSSVSTDAIAYGFKPYITPFGSPQVRFYQESTAVSSQVIRAGHVVSFDTVAGTNSNRIVTAPSSGGAAARMLNTTNVVGVALANSTSDGSTTGLGTFGCLIPVAVADANTIFLGYLCGDLPNVSSIVGLQRAVKWDSTRNVFTVDSTNSTAADWSVVITGVPPGSVAGGESNDTVGDTNGPVLFKFLSSQTAPTVR